MSETLPVEKKSWLNPRWVTVGGQDHGPVDIFGAVEEPDQETLLRLYDDTVYSCVKWMADTVSSIELRTYVKTLPGQSKPKCLTAPVHKSAHIDRLANLDAKEVLEHPFKDLIERPNESMSKLDMLRIIDTDLSLSGNAYLEKYRAPDGLPEKLFPMQPDRITMAFDDEGHHIGFWEQRVREPRFLKRKDVIWFKLLDPRNIWGLGFSPLRGVFERVLLAKYELGYLSSLFRNQARPDSVVAVKGIIATEAERMQKEYAQRFREGGIGGVMVVDSEEVDVKPLGWSPKDTLGTELYKWNKLQILNAFGLNPAIFDQESSNRAVFDGAFYASMMNAVCPRLRSIEERLNFDLASEFSDRLLVCFDNAVPKDRAEDLNEDTALVNAKILSPNEVREKRGLEPTEWGKLPADHQESPLAPWPDAPEEEEQPDQPEQPAGADTDVVDAAQEQANQNAADTLRSTVGAFTQISALQEKVQGGQISAQMARASAEIMLGLKPEDTARLFPDQPKPKPEPQQAPGMAPPGPGAEAPPPQEPPPPMPEGKGVDLDGEPFRNRVKDSFFAECERDDEGHCLPGSGSGGTATVDKPTAKPSESPKPSATGPVHNPKLSKEANVCVNDAHETGLQNQKKRFDEIQKAVKERTGKDISHEEIEHRLNEAFEKAEITVNFDPLKRTASGEFLGDAMAKSGKLQSVFETGKSGVSAALDTNRYLANRDKWEKDKISKNAGAVEAKDRPKYAAVNWGNQPQGGADLYGGGVIVLKRDSVKGRMSLTPSNSSRTTPDETASDSAPGNALARTEHAVRAAGLNSNEVKHSRTFYTECQIWGEQELSSDTVQEIRLPKPKFWQMAAKKAQAGIIQWAKDKGIKVSHY